MMSEGSPSEVRCPMCSKPNPAEAEVCEFCGARIKPLVIQPGEDAPVLGIRRDEPQTPGEQAPPEPVDLPSSPAEASEDSDAPQETDWLSRMRGGMDAEPEPSPDAAETEENGVARGKTDLLGRLKGLGLAEEEEQPSLESRLGGVEPAKKEEETPEPDESGDWLSRIRSKQEDEAPAIEAEPESPMDPELSSRMAELESAFEPAVEMPEPEVDNVDDEIDSLLDQLDERLASIAPAEETQISELEVDQSSPTTVEPLTSDLGDEEDLTIADLIDDFESDRPIEEHELEFVDEPQKPLEAQVDDLALNELFAEIDSSPDLIDSGEATPLAEIFGDEEEASSALEDLFESIEATDTPSVAETEERSVTLDDEQELARIDQLLDSIQLDSDAGMVEEKVSASEADPQVDDLDLELEELFGESDTKGEDAFSGIEDAELLAALKETEEADSSELEDLFADFEGPIGTGELLSAAQDVPPELTEDLGSSSKLEQLFAEMEAGRPSPGAGTPPNEGELETASETLIDPDFLADLGVEPPEEAETPLGLADEPDSEFEPGMALAEESGMEDEEPRFIPSDFLAPGSDSLAAAPEEVEFDDDAETLRLDPSSAPPFSLGDVEREEVDQRLDEIQPSWLSGDQAGDEEGELPHVPALIVDEDSEFVEEDFLTGSVIEGDMPSWLQDLGADIDDEDLVAEEEPAIELARANLPPWLEAMRPIETFNVEAAETESVEDEFVEAAGPLAGLKGVLLAEPVVAMPRTASAGVAALDITERHYANTEILRKMVAEEELELAQPSEFAKPYPIVRWIIASIVVLAVSLPMILGFPSFNEPRFAPRGLNALLETVNASPTDRPALMVFDYEPGYSAEMDTAAGALVENVLSRDQSIVTLSTRQTGPLLADRMILRIGSGYEITNGIDYVHLGYLSGGASAIQLFASSPRDSLTSGFRAPEDEELGEGWDTPPLLNIQNISDFSTITIITSGTEIARTWIEQLSPVINDTPLIVVVTAGAEPIVRPYFESRSPQIQGILTGLQAAVKYEVWNGRLGDASQRWNSFGAGMIVAELILITGLVYSGVTWFLRQRKLISN